MTDNCQNNQDKEKRIAELEALLAKQVAQKRPARKKRLSDKIERSPNKIKKSLSKIKDCNYSSNKKLSYNYKLSKTKLR